MAAPEELRLLVAFARVQDLLLRAKHLFVAAMMAWVHPRAHSKSANQSMMAVRRSLANRRLSRPLSARSRTCCFAPNTCSSRPWWLGFIPVLPGIGKSEDRGAVRIRSCEVFRGSKN